MLQTGLRFRTLALTLLLFLGPTLPSHAAEPPIRVGVGQALAPFAIPEAEAKAGLMVDIIRAAFEVSGRQTDFLFLPNARIPMEFSGKRLDVSTMSKVEPVAGVYFTHWPVLTFLNKAITLKRRNLRINTITDLGRYRVVAFQGAHLYLEPEFAAMAAANKHYSELSRMPSNMLLLQHTDVMVSQPDIFRFNLQGDAAVAGPPAYDEIQYHPVFAKGNQYWFAFHSAALRDQFEAGLAALYSSGKIDLIFSQYQRRYATSREMFISLDCQFLKKNKPAVCKTMAMLEH